MKQLTLEIPATLDYLMVWLKRYAAANVPEVVTKWRFVAGEPWIDRLFKFGSGPLCQNASIRGVPWGDCELPVIEFWVRQQADRCSVTIRCNEQLLEEWFQTLTSTMVKKWLARDKAAPASGSTKRRSETPSARGCKGLPLAERDRFAAEWDQAKGQTLQPIFCAERGFSTSALRVWYKDWKDRQQNS